MQNINKINDLISFILCYINNDNELKDRITNIILRNKLTSDV